MLQVHKEMLAPRALQDPKVCKVFRVLQVPLVYRGFRVFKVQQEPQARKDYRATLVRPERKVAKV